MVWIPPQISAGGKFSVCRAWHPLPSCCNPECSPEMLLLSEWGTHKISLCEKVVDTDWEGSKNHLSFLPAELLGWFLAIIFCGNVNYKIMTKLLIYIYKKHSNLNAKAPDLTEASSCLWITDVGFCSTSVTSAGFTVRERIGTSSTSITPSTSYPWAASSATKESTIFFLNCC